MTIVETLDQLRGQIVAMTEDRNKAYSVGYERGKRDAEGAGVTQYSTRVVELEAKLKDAGVRIAKHERYIAELEVALCRIGRVTQDYVTLEDE